MHAVNAFLQISEGFYTFADIRTTHNGFPRLHFNGYTYGRRYAKSNTPNMHWKCTRIGVDSRKRCLASLVTKVINGYSMVRVKNPNHTCNTAENFHDLNVNVNTKLF